MQPTGGTDHGRSGAIVAVAVLLAAAGLGWWAWTAGDGQPGDAGRSTSSSATSTTESPVSTLAPAASATPTNPSATTAVAPASTPRPSGSASHPSGAPTGSAATASADLRRIVLAQMSSGGIQQGVAGALVEALDGIDKDLAGGRSAAQDVSDLGDLITQQITEGTISQASGRALDGPYAALSVAVR